MYTWILICKPVNFVKQSAKIPEMSIFSYGVTFYGAPCTTEMISVTEISLISRGHADVILRFLQNVR